ncbi:hypothetical protein [Anatilimnocola floriformis]|uniref:hypothetical protein n=1 Tax=Anatilimnocola floriformis TaxID=2948575 RepID=UPI0020C46350|nr:hypothetical protein [Anatilimnocola floriformis]
MKLPFLMIGLCCCLFTSQAWGDALPGPGPAPNAAPPAQRVPNFAGEAKTEKVTLNLTVKHADLKGEGDGVQAKLILPAKLRDLPPPAAAPGKVGQQESSPRSLIAAIALSLAAVSVVFVIRGKRWSAANKAALLAITVAAAGCTLVYANAGPPRNRAPKSQIVIEFSADATEVMLTLPEK